MRVVGAALAAAAGFGAAATASALALAWGSEVIGGRGFGGARCCCGGWRCGGWRCGFFAGGTKCGTVAVGCGRFAPLTAAPLAFRIVSLKALTCSLL